MPQQIRVNPVLRVRVAGSRPLVDRRQPHLRHQPPHPPAADVYTLARQMADHLPVAIPRHIEERRVDHPHQRQRFFGLGLWRIIERRSADRQQTALRRDRQIGVHLFDHPVPSIHAHRRHALAKKSRSTTNCPILECSLSISASPLARATSEAPAKVEAIPSRLF